MNTIASILVNGVKQRFYFGNTVFLENDTEFEIEIFNKSQRTVCPSLTINGETLPHAPVIYNGQKYILKDYITDNRRFLFKVYQVDASDKDVKEAIKENGIISIEYYYEKSLERGNIKQDQKDSSKESDSNTSISDPEGKISYSPKHADDTPEPDDYFFASPSEIDTNEETGKIMKGSPSGVTYNSVDIELDYNNFETQIIKLKPLSKKPKFINCPKCQHESKIEANYCEECGYKYSSITDQKIIW